MKAETMAALNLMTRVVFTVASMSTVSSAFADRPPWAGGGKQEKHQQKERHIDHGGRQQYGGEQYPYHDPELSNYHGGQFFIDRHRTIIHDYYVNEYRSGHCPPGLAKKRNGCLPPGQARKWVVGRPLPSDVIFYDLPSAVLMNMGPPPPGYRFVRVASDILMIAIGTGMVMDAIHDLGGL